VKTYTRDDLLQAGIAVVLPLVVMLILYVVGDVTSRLVGIADHRRGGFRTMTFASNSGFIGFPVNVALFGEQALPYAVIWYLVQTFLFWTLGAYGLSVDAPRFSKLTGNAGAATSIPPVFSMATVKNVITPPLIGSVVAVVLILGEIRLPKFVDSTFTYLGGMTTPLAMLFLGIAIYLADLRVSRFGRDIWFVVVARFLLAPAIVLAVTALVPVPELMRKVFIIEAAMPVMMTVSIAARAYNADTGYIAVATALTTVMAMVTIPLYFLLLHFGAL
jgi:malate permease and related proteins